VCGVHACHDVYPATSAGSTLIAPTTLEGLWPMAAFDFDDGIIIISSVPDFDKFAFHDFMVEAPDVTGIRVMVPESTWLDSKKLVEISTIASDSNIPLSFQSVDLPFELG
jgi:hypothetical protein